MAEIKMDLTEYEILTGKIKLLEQSLEREKLLQAEIKKLSDEKVKALEDAKMKVVKITKTEHTDVLLQSKTNVEIYNILRRVVTGNFVNDRSDRDSYRSNQNMDASIDYVKDNLFTKTKSRSFPLVETTFHGLDEIKVEIRKDLEQSIDDDIKIKLKYLDEIILKNEDLIVKNTKLTNENVVLNNSVLTLELSVEALNFKIKNYEIIKTKFIKIKDLLIDNNFIRFNIFKKVKILININNVVNEKI